MIRLMIGRDLKSLYMPPAAPPGDSVLDIVEAVTEHLPGPRREPVGPPRRDPRPRRARRLRAHRARPRHLRRRSAPRRRDQARRRTDPHSRRRARRSRAASISCRRTASARLCCSTSRSPRTSRCPISRPIARFWLVRHRARDRERAAPARAPQHPDARRRHRRRLAVRRQPAEGRARQMAVDAAEGAHLRRADARHRRRRQAGDLRHAAPSRRRRRRDPDDLERHGGGDRRQRPHRGHARGRDSAAFSIAASSASTMCCSSPSASTNRRRGRSLQKKDLGLLVLILVVGAVVAIINPRFLLAGNLSNTANQVGLFGIFSDRRGLRHHHRRHRAVGRLGDRAARRALHRPHRQPRRQLGAGRRRSSSPAGLLIGVVHGSLVTTTAHAALRRHAVRPADLSRRRALLHRGRHRRLRLRRELSDARMADRRPDQCRWAFRCRTA